MIRAMSGAGRQARASCDRVLRWRKALWKSQAQTSRHLSPPKRLARVARLLPRRSRRSWRPEIPPRRTSPRSPKRRGHFRSTFSEATPAGRFAATGSAAPRAGGRLSAAAGCAEHTVQWSPTVTTSQSTRLSEPWQRHSEAGAAARTKAVVARQDAHAWLRRDRARAPSSLDRQPEQARARSCVGTDRTDDRRDPDHRAVASPRGAVISSARALLRFVQLDTLVSA